MRRGRGFSLAEVLFSLSVLATVAVMAIGILHFALFSDRHGEARVRASLLAQEKLAWAERAPLADLERFRRGAFPAPFADFAYQMDWNAAAPGLVRLSVEVTGPSQGRSRLWTHRREHPRQVVVVVKESRERSFLARVPEEGGLRQPLAGTLGSDTQPAVSPDGNLLAFVSDQGGLGLWSVPTDGSAPARRWQGLPAGATSPAFSPDGRQVAVVAPVDGINQLFLYDSHSESVLQLTHLDASISAPAWSPDGGRLAVSQEGTEILLLSASGSVEKTLTQSAGWNTGPSFSPDGQWIAFMSTRNGNPEIYRMRSDGSGVERLTQDPGYDTHPRWSADGTKLVFQSDRGGQKRAWTMNADGSEQRRIWMPEDESESPGRPEDEPLFLP